MLKFLKYEKILLTKRMARKFYTPAGINSRKTGSSSIFFTVQSEPRPVNPLGKRSEKR